MAFAKEDRFEIKAAAVETLAEAGRPLTFLQPKSSCQFRPLANSEFQGFGNDGGENEQRENTLPSKSVPIQQRALRVHGRKPDI